MSDATPTGLEALQNVRSLAFDLMGTCVDWETSIILAFKAAPPLRHHVDFRHLARDWRAGFFRYILESFGRGEESPDIDVVHAEILDALLSAAGVSETVWNSTVRQRLVQAWHRQLAWPDSIPGIERLRSAFDVVVLANGTTRLQLDIASSSRLPFHALFSSQLLGHTKPDLAMYRRCVELLVRQPSEVAMVAAHAYDLRAAKEIGMRTIYIQRDTEDPDEDMDAIRADVDIFIDGRRDAAHPAGLERLAELLIG